MLDTRFIKTSYRIKISATKQVYYKKRLCENKNNIKGTWNMPNTLIKRGSSRFIYPEYVEDV